MNLSWEKRGVVFVPDGSGWMCSHASLPVVDPIDGGRLRIYFGTRDSAGRSLTTYLEVDENDPRNVLYVHDRPILQLGFAGSFDDNGIMPSWIVSHNGRKYLYYIGWNPQVTVSYRLAIGLACSEDGGLTFTKVSEGPVLDRCYDEPFFTTAPSILFDDGVWKMWYVSCTGWKRAGARMEPLYRVKYAESSDGIRWVPTGKVCIDYDSFTEAIGRPCVFREDGMYRMYYSYRSGTGYREDPARSYRLGYAESENGTDWVRKDDDVGITRSATGWDSQMIEYSWYIRHRDRTYLFYNGNGFGASGIGYAVSEDAR